MHRRGRRHTVNVAALQELDMDTQQQLLRDWRHQAERHPEVQAWLPRRGGLRPADSDNEGQEDGRCDLPWFSCTSTSSWTSGSSWSQNSIYAASFVTNPHEEGCEGRDPD